MFDMRKRDKKKMADFIKAKRRKLSLTQSQVGILVGSSQSRISQLEHCNGNTVDDYLEVFDALFEWQVKVQR